MAKEIKRVIFVNDPSEVDFENFGVHFTEDRNYNHNGGGSNGLTPDADYKVTVWCKRYSINEAATEVSRNEYPHEKEVVLDFNQNLNVEVSIMKGSQPISFEKRKINTGTRCDKWVNEI